MSQIQRLGDSARWSDVVIYAGTARWVEVAEDMTQDFRGQTGQILQQIDQTLHSIGSLRSQLLQVVIYVADLDDVAVLNELWDAWVPAGHAPIRACVGVRLGSGCLVEMIVEAAVGAWEAVDSETATACGNSNGEPGT